MHTHEPAQFTAHRLTGLLFLLAAAVWFVSGVISSDEVGVTSLAIGVVFAGIGAYFLALGRGTHVN